MAFGSLFTGVTALQANQQMLDVIGNNLANSNTPAFKEQNVTFADLFYQTLQPPTPSTQAAGGTNPIQSGFGAKMSSISTVNTQGTLQPTGNSLDMGIDGNGYFQESDGNNTYYTRAGSFAVDSSGFLRDPATGFNVMRFGNVGEPATTSAGFQVPGDDRIKVPFGAGTPGQVTTTVGAVGNLNASAAVGDTVPTAIQIYDQQGNAHTLSLTFTNTAVNTWSVSATVPQADVAPVTTTTNGVTTTTPGTNTFTLGPITFGADGSPSSLGTTSLSVTFAGTQVAQTVNTTFASKTGAFDGVTQFGGTSSAAITSQDGFASGTLTSVNVGKDGTISGVFSNGKVTPLATLAIASFANQSGLQREGNNLMSVTSQSGEALVGAGESAGRGAVQQGVLEQSNVDVATEFTQLIVAQRSYEMNAKTITVSDQVLQTLTNIIQ
jgi:flagellar hook protein FlgE